VPDGDEATVQEAGVIDLLTRAYSKRAEGGGFANFDVPGLLNELQGLAAKSGSSIFQIVRASAPRRAQLVALHRPRRADGASDGRAAHAGASVSQPPYFAYIAKAFATLEGIGLQADPGYSIINETLPYISRRILTDPSPRTAGALETFVFGEAKEDRDARVLDAGRVTSLVDGVQRFDASGGGGLAALETEAQAEAAAAALLDLLKDDTPAARLVTEQIVLVLAAAVREGWADARVRSGSTASGRSLLGTLVDPLGVFRQSALVNNDARDRAALDAARQLADFATELLGATGGGAPSEEQQRLLVRALVRQAWERRDALPDVTRRVAVEALDQAAGRMRAAAVGRV
jgi:hypothetical protein